MFFKVIILIIWTLTSINETLSKDLCLAPQIDVELTEEFDLVTDFSSRAIFDAEIKKIQHEGASKGFCSVYNPKTETIEWKDSVILRGVSGAYNHASGEVEWHQSTKIRRPLVSLYNPVSQKVEVELGLYGRSISLIYRNFPLTHSVCSFLPVQGR